MPCCRPKILWASAAFVFVLANLNSSVVNRLYPDNNDGIINLKPTTATTTKSSDNNSNDETRTINYVVWTYPMPPQITNDDDDGTSLQLFDGEVFLCAYQNACPKKNETAVAAAWEEEERRLNLRELTYGTPYHEAVMNHAFQKVVQGRDYPDHVQSMTLLALVHKNPRACVRSWGDPRILCGRDLPLLANLSSYNPSNASSSSAVVVAPPPQLIPASKPDMSSLNFLSLKYQRGKGGNSGDEIQDFAAIQFQPFISGLTNRDYGWNPPVTGNVINNAWYGNPFNYPEGLERRVNMTLISIHYSRHGRTSANYTHNLQFLKQYAKGVGPIGARDTETLEFLKQLRVPAYLSQCLTLTLQLGCECRACPACGAKRRDDIVINDVKNHLLPAHIQKRLQEGGSVVKVAATMSIPRNDQLFPNTFEYAFHLMTTYANRAKLVITSRLHAALPALAMGVSVIFVSPKGKLPGGDPSRMSGILELLNVYRPGVDEWSFDLDDPPQNPGVHIADRNRASLWNYLKRRSSFYEDSARLHGMIPMQRLGKEGQFPDIQDTFHFVPPPPQQQQPISWQFTRAIEYVFFHHPNARVVIHSNYIATVGSRLDIFQETGYNLSIKPYEFETLLNEVIAKLPLVPRIMSELRGSGLQASDTGRGSHSLDLVGLLVLLREGGVYLSHDMYLLKPIPAKFNNIIHTGDGTGSIMILEPGHNAGLAVVQWIQNNRMQQQLSTSGRVMTSALLDSDLLQSVQSFRPEELRSLPGESLKSCLTTKIDLDVSNAYAVHIASNVSHHYDTVVSGSTCDDLLYRHCIFCDELHTRPAAFDA